MSDWEASAKVVSSKVQAFGVLLIAWLVPGAGHLCLGRKKKAALLASIIIVTFFLGVYLDGRLYRFEKGQCPSETLINTLGALAGLGNGILSFLAFAFGFSEGKLEESSFDIGVTFLLSAGLFNILTTIDAYRCAIGYDYDAAEVARRAAKAERKAKKRAKKAKRNKDKHKRAEQ